MRKPTETIKNKLQSYKHRNLIKEIIQRNFLTCEIKADSIELLQMH